MDDKELTDEIVCTLNEKIQEKIEYYGNNNTKVVKMLQKISKMINDGEKLDLVLLELINAI